MAKEVKDLKNKTEVKTDKVEKKKYLFKKEKSKEKYIEWNCLCSVYF